jgi:hypothetical protein
MQCEQSEYQRQTCRHVDLGEGKVGKKHHGNRDSDRFGPRLNMSAEPVEAPFDRLRVHQC